MEGETDIPKPVKEIINFFERKNIWFNLSRNVEAFSCRDAAQKRNRLGYAKIPLRDELKSYFAKIKRKNKIIYVIFHCQGDQIIDWKKVKKLFEPDDKIEKISENELFGLFKMARGKVNPFTLDPFFIKSELLQVFDKSLEEERIAPYTMMTNAGDLTWAVEFYPKDIIQNIGHRRVADIVKEFIKPIKYKIGILTGNGPDSGIYLWNKINEKIREKLKNNFAGDLSFPEVIVHSIPEMGLSMELDIREKDTWDVVNRGINSLCDAEATIIAVACNTTQYYSKTINEICKLKNAEFISIPNILKKYLVSNQSKQFAFIGIKHVTEIKGGLSGFSNLSGFDIEKLSDSDIHKISDLGFKVKQEGATGAGINKLRDLLNNIVKSKTIVIALTEISILLSKQKYKTRKGKIIIDTLDLLAEAVVNEYLEKSKIMIDEEPEELHISE